MNNISEHLDNLSPEEKRVLLAQLLREKANQITSSYPLSYGQQALWFLHQSAPETAAYNIGITVRIRSHIDVPAMRRAFQSLVNRHPSLRTTFKIIDGHPVQEIHGYQDVCFEQENVSSLDYDTLHSRVFEVYRLPFDLEQGPLFRANLFTRSVQNHVLLLTMHHTVSDFWSLLILLDEFRVLYPAEKDGNQAPLPPLSVSYVDYIQQQSEMVSGPDGERFWTYWQQQLSGELPILNVPADRPRPPVQTYHGTSYPFKLNEKLTRRLKELAQAEGVTLYMLLLAAFQVLLHRYTGQEDILLGSPTSGRSQTEFINVIGYFVNPVVLRSDLSGNPLFTKFLGQVRQTVLDALKNQDYPFPLLVKKLHLNRDPSRSPLFQVLFVLQKPQQLKKIVELLVAGDTTTRINWGGLELEPFEMTQQEGQFDITLQIIEARESLLGVFKYNPDLFDVNTIIRMKENFQTVLEGIMENPQQPISQLPLLSPSEKYQIMVEWHDTKADYPRNKCIHELFEAQVERTPDTVAVVLGEEHLTYQELNQKANRLAHYLRKLGVKPDVLVGIYMDRSLEMIVGILAILKAGGAYVPMDLVYPKDRIAFMLEDCQAPILLTQDRLAKNLPKSKTQVICVDKDWETIAQESNKNPVSGVATDNVIYVIYTSGSTGKPKGVLVTHYNVDRLFKATQQWYHFDEQDVWTLFHSYAFDFSVWEMWGALLYGGRLIVIPYDVSRSPEEFYALLCKEQVTVLNQTPSAFRQLIQVEDTLGVADSLALRLVIFGGEALELQSLKPWFERHGDNSPQLVNMYGITETTIHVTYRPLTIVDVDKAPGSVIGFPIPDLHVYILDQHAQPVPIGIPGEMYIGGAGVSRGYLNRDELTSERFLPNPFGPKSASRLYRTGDLARYLPDGDIEYLGRIDFQVQIRGFRVELGEIESILASHPAVREVVVIAREKQPGEMQLVAYLVPKQEQNPTVTKLRAFLKEKLPEYMVPSAFVMVEAFPLTPNGKINRRALPAPEGLRPELETAYVMPRTETEQVLAKLWKEVLQVDKVGIHDNFFDLGGHSLLAVQLHNKVQDEFGQEISLIDLFQYSTIHSLAQRIHPDQQEKSSIESGQDRAKKRLAREASMQQARQRRQRHRTPKHQKGESYE